jgi:hypothetical protein
MCAGAAGIGGWGVAQHPEESPLGSPVPFDSVGGMATPLSSSSSAAATPAQASSLHSRPSVRDRDRTRSRDHRLARSRSRERVATPTASALAGMAGGGGGGAGGSSSTSTLTAGFAHDAPTPTPPGLRRASHEDDGVAYEEEDDEEGGAGRSSSVANRRGRPGTASEANARAGSHRPRRASVSELDPSTALPDDDRLPAPADPTAPRRSSSSLGGPRARARPVPASHDGPEQGTGQPTPNPTTPAPAVPVSGPVVVAALAPTAGGVDDSALLLPGAAVATAARPPLLATSPVPKRFNVAAMVGASTGSVSSGLGGRRTSGGVESDDAHNGPSPGVLSRAASGTLERTSPHVVRDQCE